MAATIKYVVKEFHTDEDGNMVTRSFGEPIMVIDMVANTVTLPPNPEDGYAALLIEGLTLWRKAMDEQPEFAWVLTVEC